MTHTHLIYILGNEFEVDLEFDYYIHEGQRQINNPPDLAQPYIAPELEMELTKAEIGYGHYQHVLTKESRWWDIIEEGINEDMALHEDIFERENNLYEDGRW